MSEDLGFQWAGKLHCPRKSGFSFAPLRLQVCRDPGLRKHPYFPAELRKHWWKALKDAGYTGAISVECVWDDLPRQLPDSVHFLHSQLNDVGLDA